MLKKFTSKMYEDPNTNSASSIPAADVNIVSMLEEVTTLLNDEEEYYDYI